MTQSVAARRSVRVLVRVVAGCPRVRILASSQDARARLARLLPPAALARVESTYTGVNSVEIDAVRGESVDRAALSARLALPPAPFLVVRVGQFIDRKGRWPFLEAARAVVAGRPDIGFVWLANSAPDRADLDRVAAYGLGTAFRLLTAADLGSDHREVFRVLRAGDVFCLPTFTDGLPIALLEAMALGLPVISTPVFAIPEAIRDGDTGLLVAAGDATGLARAVLALRDDPALIPIAIEEALRFDSPAQGLFRANSEECTVHGVTIPEGSKLQVLFASANRDPRKFDRPDEFDIDRPQKERMGHVAFGWGIHHCIGAPLARLETKVSFEKILRRMGDIELAGTPVRNDSFVLHGLTSLPLRWRQLA